jgi:antiphage defense system Thoeris ThsB-like protein
MARRVFFSFHYARDSWRVSQVRNCWLTKQGADASPFLDKAEWEAIERQGKHAVRNWIDAQMYGTSVTVVLIGRTTADREWVQYEIRKSHSEGKGLLGIYIHNLQNQHRQTDFQGPNPFDRMFGTVEGVHYPFYRTYDWVYDDGYRNISTWIEAAARDVGR